MQEEITKIEFNNKVLAYIQKHNLIIPNDILIVGVSGGIDSSSLLFFLKQVKNILNIKQLIVAHLNHGLRGEEADRDELFVKQLANKFGLTYESMKLNIKELALLDNNKGLSIQEVARKYRQLFFEDLFKKYHATKIVTAHNKDDLAETVLMWLIRGTGPNGAQGIKPYITIKRNKIEYPYIKPFLAVTREEIQYYNSLYKIGYVEDSSNQTLKYTRNKIRHKVMPLLESIHPGASNNIVRFANILIEDEVYFSKKVNYYYKKYATIQNNTIIFPLKIMFLEKAIFSRIILKAIKDLSIRTGLSHKELTYSHIETILSLKDKEGTKQFKFGDFVFMKTSTQFVIGIDKYLLNNTNNIDTQDIVSYAIKIPGKTNIKDKSSFYHVEITAEVLHIKKFFKDLQNNEISKLSQVVFGNDDKLIFYFDYDKIQLPIFLRQVKQGDKIYPLFSIGHKKISDYFIDNKVPYYNRWNSLVIESNNGNIIALLCKEINKSIVSELVKISKNTNLILKLEIKSF